MIGIKEVCASKLSVNRNDKMVDKLLLKKENKYNSLIILFFIFYCIIGLFVYNDYGMTPDEEIQRTHSLVSYKYINETLFSREMEELSNIPELNNYPYRFYGTAIQIPLVVIEDIFDFGLSKQVIYYIRHLYTFFICVVGYICFYCFLNNVFSDKRIAFFGVSLIILYPRFYAYQFCDIKNMIFTALCMITLFSMYKVAEKPCVLNIIFFSVAAALATNQRVMGIIFPGVLIGYFLILDILKWRETVYELASKESNPYMDRPFCLRKKSSIKYFCILILYYAIWIVITPAAWGNPLIAFYDTITVFSHYDSWNGTMVFLGKLITCEEQPWYYLFVWFGISIPLAYIVLFIIGHIYFVTIILKKKLDILLEKQKWLLCSLVIFWSSVIIVIVMDARIYLEWRHLFWVFPPFCCIATYGLYYLTQAKRKGIVYIIIGSIFVSQCIWMIYNHPFQQVYFNVIGKQWAAEFDRDTWHVANSAMLNWILDQTEETVSISGESVCAKNARLLLNDKEQKRVIIGKQGETDYMLEYYRNIIGNSVMHEGYIEVYSIWVDGFKIGSVFEKL